MSRILIRRKGHPIDVEPLLNLFEQRGLKLAKSTVNIPARDIVDHIECDLARLQTLTACHFD